MQQLQQKSDEHAQPEEEETHPPNRSVKRRGDRNLPEANVPKSRKVAEPHAPGSSLLADTTTFLADGIIAIVKRTAALPGFCHLFCCCFFHRLTDCDCDVIFCTVTVMSRES
jgi:hypothetical protein